MTAETVGTYLFLLSGILFFLIGLVSIVMVIKTMLKK